MQILDFLADHWVLSAIFFGCSALLISLELRRAGNLLTAEQLVDRLNRDGALLYDLRGEAPHGAGHIAGAEALDPTTEAAKLAERLRKSKKGQKAVILVCENGGASANMAKALAREGIADANALKGGLRRWKEDNLPLVTGNKPRGAAGGKKNAR